jgi:hypothetical protein
MVASYMLSNSWINVEIGSKRAWNVRACSLEGRGTRYLKVIFVGKAVNISTKYGTRIIYPNVYGS